MDRLQAMALLVKIADRGNMSAVARELNMPLTTVSRGIAELEGALAVRLLHRTTRKISLTDAGAEYVAAARRILDDVENAERQASGEYQTPRGELVVAAPGMFGRLHVLPLVNEFLAAWPDIRVRLLLSDRNSSLIEEHIDVAIRIGPLPDSGLVARRLGEMRTLTCASPGVIARHGAPAEPQALLNLPCITIENPMPHGGWRYLRPGRSQIEVVDIRPRLAVTTPEAASEAAIAGVGAVQLLHYQAVDALATGALQPLLSQFEPPAVPVSLLHHPGIRAGQPLPLKLAKFVEFVAPRLRQTLTQINQAPGSVTPEPEFNGERK